MNYTSEFLLDELRLTNTRLKSIDMELRSRGSDLPSAEQDLIKQNEIGLQYHKFMLVNELERRRRKLSIDTPS